MFNFMQKTFTSAQATTLYEMGLLNLGFKRYSTAIEYFTQAIALDSKYADAFYQRGIAFKELGEQQKATSDFQQALNLNPKLLDALLAAAKTDMDLKFYSLAIRRFDHVLEVNPRLDKIFIQRASAKCALRKYKEAIKDYDEAIKLKPEEHTYCGRGNVKASLGLYDEAIADYQQALQLNPQSTSALLNRGIVAYNLGGKYHQAFIDFSNVLKLVPNHTLALYYLGLVNFDLGNYEDADINIGISIEIHKNEANVYDIDAYIASGIVRQLIGPNLQVAVDDFTDANSLIQMHIERDPYNVEAWIKLFILRSSYKYDSSKASWDKIINGFEGCIKSASLHTPAAAALCHYYLARAYQINREFAKAEENFLQSIKLEENSRIYYEYAHFLTWQMKRTSAISKLQRALELSADGECITYYSLFLPSLTNELQDELKQSPRLSVRVSVLARWWLIKCYLAEGEKNNAEQQLDNLLKAVEDFPTPLAYSLLGYACQALEQWHLAARSFKTAFLLRTNYSLARQNLKKCLNQLSIQESDVEPFAIIAQTSQLLISSQNQELVIRKPKSVIENAQSALSKTISQLTGLKYEEIPGNGHCLFIAVGLYLGEDQNFLRCIVVAHIEHNLSQFAQYLALPKGKTIEDYLQDVKSGQEWADHIEIEVLMRVLNRPIMVIDSSGRPRNPEDANRFEGEPIFVYYNGRDHYDALLLPEGISGKDVLRTITNHSDQLIDLQQPLTQLSERSHVSQSTNPSVLSDEQQKPTQKPLTEKSKLNPKQHSSYESMSNRTSPEANSVNEIKSPTYYEFYQLTDSHKSGEQLLKLPMEEFVDNKKQKSSEQKSEKKTALLPMSSLPNTSKEENKKEPNDAPTLNFMQKTFTSVQATTLYGTGCLNLGLKRYQTAIEYFTQAIELDSQYADAFYQRSIAFEEMGEPEKATADLQKVGKLNPKFFEDMFTSAMADIDFNLYQSAIKKFDDILRGNPKLDKVFIERALIKCALRNYKEAIQDFNEAIKLKPAERTYCDRGNAKAKLGFYEEAMADYQQALQLNPQNTYALLSRGITTYELGGRYYQALDDFKKVLELDPTYALALYHDGLVRFELGDFNNADMALGRSIKIAENKKAKNVNTYVMSGIVRLTAGWKTTAATRFERACELISKQIVFDPSDIDTKIELLEHLESIGVDVQLLASSLQKTYGNIEKFKESIDDATHPHLAALAYYYIARTYQIYSAFYKTELDKAEETFLQSIKLEENSRVNYEYANLLIKQEKIALAISKLQRAIELSNDGKCITYYRLSSPLLLNPQLQEELKLLPRLYIRVSVLATWQLINCYCVVGKINNAEQQLNNLLKAVEDFPSPLAYSLLGHACQALKQWHLAARSFKTAVLLRANYSLAQQNLQKCLNQLSVQENEIKPFEIIAQVQQLLVSQNSEPGKQEQESTIRSTNSPQLSNNEQQEIDKETATERSKLNLKQHSNYKSMNNRTSAEATSVNEIKSPTYYEFYQLTDSHQSGEQLLKLPMEEFVSNQNQKSSQQKSETETPLAAVSNLPNTSKEENEKEPDDGQGNRFQI